MFCKTINKKGLYSHCSFAIISASDQEDENHAIGMNYTTTWQLKNKFAAGAGTGIEIWDFPILPVYAVMEYNILRKRVSPYIFVNSGYSFVLENYDPSETWIHENRGGLLIKAGIGIKQTAGSRAILCFMISYRFQHFSVITNWDTDEYRITTNYDDNRIEAGFGVSFY